MRPDDVVLVLLIGHGTAVEGPEGDDGKFNLVGPDLTAAEWADLLKPLPGRLVFVKRRGGQLSVPARSSPARPHRAHRDRSAAQQFETVFPEFFVKALRDAAADLDKNGRVSIWEAFRYGARG